MAGQLGDQRVHQVAEQDRDTDLDGGKPQRRGDDQDQPPAVRLEERPEVPQRLEELEASERTGQALSHLLIRCGPRPPERRYRPAR
jgi:hypothetical protein